MAFSLKAGPPAVGWLLRCVRTVVSIVADR
jgi:hypothetical protein